MAAALLLLGCEGDDMGAQFTPQWGRSFQVPAPFQPQTHQLVRLQLPQSQDITLYLQGLDYSGAGPQRMTYNVAIGSGGISIVERRVQAPAVGVVRHFVADSVTVEAVLPTSPNYANGQQARIAACAALGSPSRTVEMGAATDVPPVANSFRRTQDDTVGWVSVFSGTAQYVRVPQWATGVRIAGVPQNFTDRSKMLIYEYDVNLAVNSTHRTVDEYGDSFTPFDLDTIWLGIYCTDGAPGAVFRALVQFEVAS